MNRVMLGALEEKSLPVQGQFLFIRRADGAVTVTVERADGRISSYPMKPREQIEFPGGMKSLKVQDASGATNDVLIMTGWGRFVPFNDGTEVTIAGQVDPVTVEFVSPPEVSINGGVSANITDPVQVFTDPAAPLAVSQSAPVEVVTDPASPLHVVHAPVPSAALAGVTIQPDVAGQTVAANAARKVLLIKAKADNAAPVQYAGIDLDPGERVEILTTAAVELIAANAADAVQILEVA